MSHPSDKRALQYKCRRCGEIYIDVIMSNLDFTGKFLGKGRAELMTSVHRCDNAYIQYGVSDLISFDFYIELRSEIEEVVTEGTNQPQPQPKWICAKCRVMILFDPPDDKHEKAHNCPDPDWIDCTGLDNDEAIAKLDSEV